MSTRSSKKTRRTAPVAGVTIRSGAARSRLGLPPLKAPNSGAKRSRATAATDSDSPDDIDVQQVANMQLHSPAKKAKTAANKTRSKPTSARKLSFDGPPKATRTREKKQQQQQEQQQQPPPQAHPLMADSTEDEHTSTHEDEDDAGDSNSLKHDDEHVDNEADPRQPNSDAESDNDEHLNKEDNKGEEEEAEEDEEVEQSGNDDDDEEEEAAPVPPVNWQEMLAQIDSSDSDDEPAPKKKKKAAKVDKRVIDSSDSETDEQALSPHPRGKANAKVKAAVKAAPASSAPQQAFVPAPSSPVKQVKSWHEPVNGNSSSMLGAVAGSRAPTFHIKVLGLSDMSSALNQGGKVAHIKTIAHDMETNQPMLIVAYGPEAIKYQSALQPNHCYTVQLEATPVPADRPVALQSLKFTHRIARGTSVRAYEAPAGGIDLESKFGGVRVGKLCPTIDHVARTDTKHLVHLHGIVVDVTRVSTKSSMGMKVTLADEKATVKVMFFEARANLKRGDWLLLLGASVWINPMTKAKEVSVYNSTFVSTNSVAAPPSEKMKKIERENRWEKLIQVSAVPSGPLVTMSHLFELMDARLSKAGEHDAMDAAVMEKPIAGTVELHLDPQQPSTGNFWYNGCNKCMKKMSRTGDKDENGDELYAHEVDGAHRDTTYTEHFLFNGRFKEPTDAVGTIYRFQVNDVLGVRLFGGSAEDLLMLTQEQQLQRIKSATATFRYNVTINNDKQIASMIMV